MQWFPTCIPRDVPWGTAHGFYIKIKKIGKGILGKGEIVPVFN
jgi:hypothetical protein